MAVKIKLQRLGKIRAPYYRVIVADSRTRRSGKAIETIGRYHPKDEPSVIQIDSDRAQYWLGVGAQPTDPVKHLLEITGDWQKFKGLPGTEGTLKVKEPKPSKQELFEKALKEAGGDPGTDATTPKKKGGGKKAPEKASEKPAEKSSEKAAEKSAPKADAKAEKAEKPAKADKSEKAEAKKDESAKDGE
ncbi:SSU ribosomal protein S16P [Herbihabitans rhizosphaerae]|uniref:Small ribosomal subunit protein bS16 n=1 Tax=Herbihabitans rhizosphaerae TaxID=1872711 RepID=A0A4Q7KJ85_9PSEU|nr:30S ribosomal protein S16 [Herbihabitans rhizosphaerae]RZS34664.1 SSU ribosomal protein S16P [Herbihabitans rhizosphaerae]